MPHFLSRELSYDKDVVKYVKRAMCAVGEDYTKRTIEAGEAEGPDYPFLSISRINNRSAETNGRLKKMIRFLKNVRTDVGLNQTLSSFDINAICYSIPVSSYEDSDYKKLVTIIWGYMYDLWYYNKLNNLKSVVGDEYVFLNKQDKITAFISLTNEVFNIKQDLNNV